MLEFLNSLESGSHIETPFLVFGFLVYLLSSLSLSEPHIWFNKKRFYYVSIHNSIEMDTYNIYIVYIILSYRLDYIYNSILYKIVLLHIYYTYTYISLVISFFACNFEYLNGRFFCFRFSSYLFLSLLLWIHFLIFYIIFY